MSNTNADTSSATTPSFIAALVTAGITVGAFSGLWLILHGNKRLTRVFQPRTILSPEDKRPAPLPTGVFAWWKTVFSTPDLDIVVANGLDAYLFVRFLKVFGLQMMVPYVILSFAVCIPIAAVAPTAGLDGLNILTYGNVATSQLNRHIGHLIVALILMAWTLYLLVREYKHFVEARQQWLASPQHQSLARTRTILVGNLPKGSNSESSIKELGGVVSRLTGSSGPRPSNVTDGTVVANGSNTGLDSEVGGIRQIWMSRVADDVEEVWQERDQECVRLEKGASKLAKLANKNQAKGKTPEKNGDYDNERSNSLADRFVLHKKRPTWKQGFLGLFGKKMDLDSSPAWIAEQNAELERMRGDEDQLEYGNTAFVRFDSQTEAHAFARLASSTDKKNRLISTQVEVVPEDVEWDNTSMNAVQRKVRTFISWALTIGLIIIWSIPVAFVGIVSNVDTLCNTAPFLAWICDLPKPVLAIIKGVLPPALLAVLFILLPIVLRMFVKLQGEILGSQIELKLFSRYWLFQVVHGFLVVTVASGLVNAMGNFDAFLQDVPTALAEKLPGASIFFLTYILVKTFATAAKAYSRVIAAALIGLRKVIGGATPRSLFAASYKMDQVKLSTTLPPICLIICITIVYSVIQPIMSLLTLIAFFMLYAAYKYILLWAADQPDSLETGGMFYIRALRTVFVSLYLEGVCLAGLFFLLKGNDGKQAVVGYAMGGIMVAMIVAVAATQIWIDWFRFKEDYLVYAHSSTSVKHSHAKNGFEKVGQAGHTVQQEDSLAGEQFGNTTGFHENAFVHPALWKKQPVVWLAEDPLGVGKFESARINEAGVESSTEFATMNEKGKIEIERGPPDEAWYGGYTQH